MRATRGSGRVSEGITAVVDRAFKQAMSKGYALDQEGVIAGSPMLGDEILAETRVQADLSMLNRHGLIAGATGTGKTKSLQLLAGQLSERGVPCFVADVKGDLTGLAAPGDGNDPKIQERSRSLDWTYEPKAHPV
ncbi:MAG TPA: helicase HerA-like domain-containing protein, partial [Actinomycetota bacterium]|nr:helicase HerA-like domain-containing protein [Actinomycetota bacterium]